MISNLINMSTGPVGISSEVINALQEPAISHRCNEFKQLYYKTTNLLCKAFKVNETFILTGSGTLANESMLQQVKHIGGMGLILSNGVFGSRLIEQSCRNNINFIAYKLEWGKPFDYYEIEKLIKFHSAKWILFCHCETSTGVINDLDGLTTLANLYNCKCFVDCMSTVGTMAMDLSKVSMATASSGKGLGSIPGLAIIFSNVQFPLNTKISVYLDLAHYSLSSGIPFTISSNLLKALYTSIHQKLNNDQYDLIKEYGKQFYSILHGYNLIPFSQPNSKVFTIAAPRAGRKSLIKEAENGGIVISYESEYLKSRQLCQIAAFGFYKEWQLKHVVYFLKKIEGQI